MSIEWPNKRKAPIYRSEGGPNDLKKPPRHVMNCGNHSQHQILMRGWEKSRSSQREEWHSVNENARPYLDHKPQYAAHWRDKAWRSCTTTIGRLDWTNLSGHRLHWMCQPTRGRATNLEWAMTMSPCFIRACISALSWSFRDHKNARGLLSGLWPRGVSRRRLVGSPRGP
jgi:hypothetical protein